MENIILETLGAAICKNLFLCNKQQTSFYLLMMPGEKPFKTKLLSKQIGSSRLSFATAEHMEELLDITPGSVSILGLMNDKEKNDMVDILRSYYGNKIKVELIYLKKSYIKSTV